MFWNSMPISRGVSDLLFLQRLEKSLKAPRRQSPTSIYNATTELTRSVWPSSSSSSTTHPSENLSMNLSAGLLSPPTPARYLSSSSLPPPPPPASFALFPPPASALSAASASAAHYQSAP